MVEAELVRQSVVIRPSRSTLVVGGLTLVGFTLFCIVLTLASIRQDGGNYGMTLVYLGLWAFIVPMCRRGFKMEVVAGPQGLLVKNLYSTRGFSWSEVKGFGVSSMTTFSNGIVVLLQSGEVVPIGATARRVAFDEFDEMLADLRAWLWPPTDQGQPPPHR